MRHFQTLVDGDGLGKVAWHVRVHTTHECELVREQLKRQDSGERGEGSVARDDHRRRIEALRELGVVCNDDHLGVPRLDLLCHCAHLHGVLVVQHKADDRGRTELAVWAVDQREGSVLERTARVALRVDVRALLNLESAFVRDGLTVALAQDEEVLLVFDPRRHLLHLRPDAVRHAEGDGQALQRLEQLESVRAAHACGGGVLVAKLAEPAREQRQDGHLRGEGLRRGDGIFTAGVAVDAKLGRARDE
mmetsp:Transcript_33477/g.57371  ORF Transcript_33477/g.57371 Transcript_33477/m.57371 type:complete len:248 (+) Transcript_33477:195-938(+)